MRSPILRVFPDSPWREQVKETWTYLSRCYRITEDNSCGTHIHISMVPNYSLTELKHIASAVIQFEPAFEALMPDHRRGNAYAVSNWLHSPYLARRNKSRCQSIEAIECANDRVEVLRLVQGYRNHYFAWNFWTLFGPKGTIEFRQPPASVSAGDTLGWAELAMNFIQASVQRGSSVRNFASNVGGLRSFLEQVHVSGVNEPVWLRSIWRGMEEEAALGPVAVDRDMLKGMVTRDKITKEAAAELKRQQRHG
jgi:Putative amidoligase enzyme